MFLLPIMVCQHRRKLKALSLAIYTKSSTRPCPMLMTVVEMISQKVIAAFIAVPIYLTA